MSRIIVSRAKYQDGLVTGETLSTETILASSVSQAVETAAAADDEAWSITVVERGARVWATFDAAPEASVGEGHLLVGPGTFQFAAAAGQKVAFIGEVAQPLERFSEPKNVSLPTVVGTPRVGETLSATAGVWEGNPAPEYSYRWLADNEVVEGAASDTIGLSADMLGKRIAVEVTATNAYGSAQVASAQTEPVAAALSAPVNTVEPAITGVARVGQTLTANRGTWTGNPTPSYAYQWKRNGANIGGANGQTYELVAADAGATITVAITATNSEGSVTATSQGIGPVAQLPSNTALPQISGTPQVGEILTATDGTWNGSPAPTYARVWKANGAPIDGATGATYTLTEAELDAEITVTVTATNSVGSAEATSAAVGPVTAAPVE